MIKLAIQNDGIVIKGITAEQLKVLEYILTGVNERCYNEKNESGEFESGGDYIGLMPESDRKALNNLAKGLKTAIDRY